MHRLLHLAVGGDRVDEAGRAVEQEERRHGADREERRQLDHRLDSDRQNQPVLMLGGVGVARAEQHGEHGKQHRHHQRDVADERIEGQRRAGIMLDHQADRAGDRLELQRDVGNRADRGDQRRDQRDVKALAVARAEEVGDRGYLLGLGERG